MSAAERKVSIIRKASRLFAEKGLHGVTTKEIAAECGISEPILYQHFKTKEDLYAELQSLCKGQTIFIKQIMATKTPSTESLCFFVFLLTSIIITAKVPGDSEKMEETEVLTRLAGHSFMEEGRFMAVLLRDCIGAIFEDWETNAKAAFKSGNMEKARYDENDLWFAYELIIGSALFHLNSSKLLPGVHQADSFLDKINHFILRGIGLKSTALKKHYHPKRWIKEIELFTNR